MALSFLRTKLKVRQVKRQFYQSKRNAGYVVLIPEIGEDGDTSTLLSKNGLPEFNDVTIERCIATVSQQSLEYENGVRQIEASAPKCKDVFTDVYQPLEKLDSQLELTWGIAKTLYLGNSSQMPTKSYLKIHERAQKARSSKFNSEAILQASIKEKEKLKDMTEEEQRLVDKYILEGKLNGLQVIGEKRDRIKNLFGELNKEKGIFRDKVDMATKLFSSSIDNAEVVRDFPQSLLQSMANDPTKGPWKLTLQPHVYEPFMKYCPDRMMRWNAWQAHTQRCSGYSRKDLDTSTNLETVRAMRNEQATALGFDNFVEMSMQTKMAGNIQNVYTQLDTLLDSARPVQDIEMSMLRDFAKDRGFDATLENWDIPYWQRKHKSSIYHYDEVKIREYFPLPKVMSTLFHLCGNLFGIQIVENTTNNTWHKDVKFYEIFEESSTEPIAGFYVDPYARRDQKIRVYDDAGWHIAIRNKCRTTSTLPLSALIFNFQAPGPDSASLLSFQEVAILFQKFGHSLRHLLTKANYSEVAGLSNVEWDAADVCGQFLAHWLYDPNTIRAISGHYKTGESIPEVFVTNAKKIRSHMAGYKLCKELYLSRLDLELYSTKTFWRDVVRELWPKYHSIPFDKFDSHPLHFTKIVSQEWAAAYYSGVWSRLIAADVYSAFEEAREADQDVLAVGKRYRDTFLAVGGSCHPGEVFRRFRGRDPCAQALLRSLGLNDKLVEV